MTACHKSNGRRGIFHSRPSEVAPTSSVTAAVPHRVRGPEHKTTRRRDNKDRNIWQTCGTYQLEGAQQGDFSPTSLRSSGRSLLRREINRALNDPNIREGHQRARMAVSTPYQTRAEAQVAAQACVPMFWWTRSGGALSSTTWMAQQVGAVRVYCREVAAGSCKLRAGSWNPCGFRGPL
jgi:hypothetical protein